MNVPLQWKFSCNQYCLFTITACLFWLLLFCTTHFAPNIFFCYCFLTRMCQEYLHFCFYELCFAPFSWRSKISWRPSTMWWICSTASLERRHNRRLWSLMMIQDPRRGSPGLFYHTSLVHRFYLTFDEPDFRSLAFIRWLGLLKLLCL